MSNSGMLFTGHETFHCRTFWLKKGFDLVNNEGKFSDHAVIDLGVGRNMVNSVRHWLRAFDVLDSKDDLTLLSKKLLDDKGWDPFLEDEASLWILHYKLVTKGYASSFPIIFNELRKTRPEFSKFHFSSLAKEKDKKQNDKTLQKDFSVFTRTYFAKNSGDKEESFSGLMSELGLLVDLGRKDSKSNTLYHISNQKQDEIPIQVLLYCILDNSDYGQSISFRELHTGVNSIGSVFCFSQEGLEQRLIELAEKYKDIVYKNDAGVKELQFKKDKPDPIKILSKYYG